MSPTSKQIHQYMEVMPGLHNLGVDPVDGVHVLIQPRDASMQKRAHQLAVAIVDAALEQQAQQLAINAVQAANETLAAQLRAARARIAELEAANEAAVTGRRRFFSPVLMKPASGDWAGAVWLLDPVKQERGLGLCFDSLAEVRRLHPELWVIGVRDGGVLLDAFNAEPFCACGRKRSECDGSRAGCKEPRP